MFTSWGANFPMYEPRDAVQWQRPSHTSRKHKATSQQGTDGNCTSTGAEQEQWGNAYYSPRQNQGDYMHDYYSTKSSSPHQSHHPGPYRPNDTFYEQRLSFEQASVALYDALEAASKSCQTLETSFATHTRGVKPWLPPKDVDSLWTIYLNWDGRPVERIADADETLSKSDLDMTTYRDIHKRLLRALSAIFTCAETPAKLGPNIDTTNGYASPSWQILRTTTRKLRISLEAIEELLGMVRVRRDCMPSLVHEILAAMQLLESIRPLWDTPAKQSSTQSKEEPYNDPRRNRKI
ncbi:hypothetical protein DOTSEDRAFT_26306 [Dothistroma septosporum NZE10]|uniref:Uncharacterized protein n=1 Tax=Dothistroma septosporum (strain NZE10 / CBS 128990) TaxID=675120 RepID=N1PML7_DOTSN|nr:hypothetical protein DOTSEDRAFT_26306 [Dothistroma septosporum NZE10]